MSLLKAKKIQIGTHATATNNFVIEQPTTPDGTLRIGNGNEGSSTDLISVSASGIALSGNSSSTNTDISPGFTYHNLKYIGKSADNSLSTNFYITLARRTTSRNAVIGTIIGSREGSGNNASGLYQVTASQGNTDGNHAATIIAHDLQNNPATLVTLIHDSETYIAIYVNTTSSFRAFDSVFFTGLTYAEQQHSLKYLEASQVSSVTTYTSGMAATHVGMDTLRVRNTLIIPVV